MVDKNGIAAKVENGILTATLPKVKKEEMKLTKAMADVSISNETSINLLIVNVVVGGIIAYLAKLVSFLQSK